MTAPPGHPFHVNLGPSAADTSSSMPAMAMAATATVSPEPVLEGIFAVEKPSMVSSAEVLVKLQAVFGPSRTFAPLLRHQPVRTSKGPDQVFRMGHGGTLDPLAAGVLIVGIGRGTRQLQQFLACTKTYETVVLFGASTDSYDCTGVVTQQAPCNHITEALVLENLARFRGTISQAPPVYSALKINGIKACEYVRQGLSLPRELEEREMQVEECELQQWHEPGQHDFAFPGEDKPADAPAARIRLTVCSGFYVRSFAHDLGIACQSYSHMSYLLRTRQANFTIGSGPESGQLTCAIPYADFDVGEDSWGPILRPQLEDWVAANPANVGHNSGRSHDSSNKSAQNKENRPRQRFRGGWVADTKKERIQQQGGKYKGKWGRKKTTDAPSFDQPSQSSDPAGGMTVNSTQQP